MLGNYEQKPGLEVVAEKEDAVVAGVSAQRAGGAWAIAIDSAVPIDGPRREHQNSV